MPPSLLRLYWIRQPIETATTRQPIIAVVAIVPIDGLRYLGRYQAANAARMPNSECDLFPRYIHMSV